jgi:hypothetical protein
VKTWGYFAGPLLTLQVTERLRLSAAAGYRSNTGSNAVASGYGKLGFTWVQR